MSKLKTVLSVVVPIQDDGAVLGQFVTDVMAVLDDNFQNFELVFVDDRSIDNTLEVVSAALKQHAAVRLIRLSQRCGLDISIAAGLDASIGDFVVVMDVVSDPPTEIRKLVDYAAQHKAVDVFVGVAANVRAEGFMFRKLRQGFHLLGTWGLGLNLPAHQSTFRGLTRRAVNALTRVRQKQRCLSLLCCHIGYEQRVFAYQKQYLTTKVKQRTLREAFDLGLSVLATSSTSPLRLVSYAGGVASLLNLIYVGYVFVVNLVKRNVAEGWTTLSLQNSTMFCLLFAILAIMSEYVGRILDEAKDRPLYHIVDDLDSSTLPIDPGARNVFEFSQANEEAPVKDRKHAA